MIKLELSIDECNTILRVLGKHQFEEVVNIINNIKQQGEPQVVALEQNSSKEATDALTEALTK